MIKRLILTTSLFLSIPMFAQTEETKVLFVNAQIDEGVVKKDTALLKILYGNDFVFTHSTGLVDSKTSWINTVKKPTLKFTSRIQDSTNAEMHGNIAILTGRIDIVREGDGKVVNYGLWYVRVFEKRKNQWQLISHRTTKEWE